MQLDEQRSFAADTVDFVLAPRQTMRRLLADASFPGGSCCVSPSGLRHPYSRLPATEDCRVPLRRERSLSWAKRIGTRIIEHAAEYRRVNRALLGSSAEPIVRREIHSMLAGFVGKEVEMEFQRRKPVSRAISPELLTYFLVSSYVSVMTWWLKVKNPVAPKEIDAAYRQLVLPSLASIFE